ncbi:MAG: lipid A export permease/ATP-binding protein MsbA [Candidatus Muproteobacteria bacterium RBG_16_62_13]|uniref:Lipid A export permease/ATP-binding protein MsbA n=1 Tax=Candidatus Muproteobacteria bacterium RBG_16_62_13 TaxID=1817756 RepID=A0A1F6T4K8_9PROT|nr:MAG: lipid A export permease/ATP-binding protein MsbA [Candidatus Muproteobacteria bacterium RBG_16_62_13]
MLGDSLKLYRRLLRYAWPYRRMYLVAILGMLVLSGTAAGFAAIMEPLVDKGFVNRDPAAIKFIPPLIIGLFVLRAIAGLVAEYANAWVGRRVTFDLRNAVFRHLLDLPAGYYDVNSSSGLIAKIIFNVEQIAGGVTRAIFTLVSDGVTIFALSAWLLYLNWKLTLIFAVLLPLSMLVIRVMSVRFRKISERIQTSMGDITQVSQEAFEGQRVVKAFGGQTAEMQAFERANEQNRRQSMRRVGVAAVGTGLVQIVGALMLASVITIALLVGDVTAGTFTSYIVAATWMMGPARRLARINETLQTSLAASASVFNVLDEEAETDTGTRTLERVEGRVEYRQVVHRYVSNQAPSLDGVSFVIEPGQTLALEGSSGSGKTTCASLLARFYLPESGAILLDGAPIEQLTLANLRSHISIVAQEALLFDDTLRRNIAYGTDREIDEARLMEAAHAAHVLEFAERLPQGLDSPVGEKGMRLSGGQRQRVAIARALYKNAPILILDEATSALDTESERLVQDAMRRLMANRTTLVIAHRLSTVEHADRIVVLARGRVEESGTHAELLARNGTYARLYRSQFNDTAA